MDPARSDADAPVLGWLSHNDFERARRRWTSFTAWRDYDEYLAERDALHLGYLFSGVTASVQRVTLEAFERWTRLTGAPADLDGLDSFAAHWRWRVRNPASPILGKFGPPDQPERSPATAGAQVVLVLPELFVRWRDGLARSKLLAAPELDAYAAHVVECCLPCRRARRTAVNSA